ncbi:MAG: tRNA lysidine(34) synthetase TilS [Actinobacteria bacterium]|nr:MAG: tRNA lysidine(34) synthetase TilS [Actinomycetota bacterium]
MGTSVTCAVSGGADSLALLVLAVESGCEVTAIHVDHGLRPGSAEDSAVVSEVAAKWGAGFRMVRVQVPAGPNLEARARVARYEALPADVLTGHTADDQAETVLLNLLRGAGIDGLAAMRRDRRPLLSLRRAETHDLCAQLGLEPVEDETNSDRRFRRNRIRHDLLPVLDAVAERDVADLLSRQSDLLRDDADLLDALAREVDPTHARVLAGAPVALARRAVRQWLGGEHPPDAATVERVLAVARGEAVATEIGKGRRVVRHQQRLAIEEPEGRQ